MGLPEYVEVLHMPSPFPGMDPYLESCAIWPDFHSKLVSEIGTELNQILPRPYYALLQSRPELGIAEDVGNVTRAIVPDIAVLHDWRSSHTGEMTAVVDHPRREVSPHVEFQIADEPYRHEYVEIRDAQRDDRLITLIEVLSPSNKRRGPDREAYARKQRDILASEVSLIEIDLLRSGERIVPNAVVRTLVDALKPAPDYLVLVSPVWKRVNTTQGYHSFPIGLRESLPCIGVPLKDGTEVALDLQYVFNRAYDAGPYRRGAVKYSQGLELDLAEGDRGWADELLRREGLLEATK
jgi:hypothetical protein